MRHAGELQRNSAAATNRLDGKRDPGLEYRPTAFRLDWMQEGEFGSSEESSEYLSAGVARNEFVLTCSASIIVCYGSLPGERRALWSRTATMISLVGGGAWARAEGQPLAALVSRNH